MNSMPPTKPKYIQVGPNAPCGIKKALIHPTTITTYLIPQHPFWRPARGSREVFTPTISRAIKAKNMVTTKQILDRSSSYFKSKHLSDS